MAQWVDFKKLRSELLFETVLLAYSVEIKSKDTARGRQHQGFCPLPNCNPGSGHSPSFSANLDKGIWQCFSCGGKGNVLDFGVLMEGLDPNNPEDFRKGALILQGKFAAAPKPSSVQTKKPKKKKGKGSKEQSPPADEKVVVNTPLDFELKSIDANHPYLPSRGFSKETIGHFGLGFCSRGLMEGRIAIPLCDMRGHLIGYAGRLVDDSKADKDHPRYMFPPKRNRDGVLYEFKKSEFVYNGHLVKTPVEDLVVVEGFTAVWWLWQHGYTATVALMGSVCPERQAEILVSMVNESGRLWLMPDGDPAGVTCAEHLLMQLSPHRLVRWVKLAEGVQPTDCKPGELSKLLPVRKEGG